MLSTSTTKQILVSVRKYFPRAELSDNGWAMLGGSSVQATIGFIRKFIANSYIRWGIGLERRFKSLSILNFCDSIMKR